MLLRVLRNQDIKLFPDVNPVRRFPNMSVVSKKHAAYSTTQVDKLRDLISERDPQLLLFIRFIYFTLARPKELRLLKVSNVRLDFKQILIRGEVSKTNIEEFVGMSPTFEEAINGSGVLNYPQDHYLFGVTGKPVRFRLEKASSENGFVSLSMNLNCVKSIPTTRSIALSTPVLCNYISQRKTLT
ncbi:MAG: hypothetical protein WDO15_06390 [Bacteroidota bacterium]